MQGLVEQMNIVVSQTLRYIIHDCHILKNWEIILATMEIGINSLPNQYMGFSPFSLNYGYEPVTPIQLLKGNEEAKTGIVASFIRRVTSDGNLAKENLQRSVSL